MPQSPQALEPQAKPHLPADRYDWAIQMANAALKINPTTTAPLKFGPRLCACIRGHSGCPSLKIRPGGKLAQYTLEKARAAKK
jgi:hypothetical protein